MPTACQIAIIDQEGKETEQRKYKSVSVSKIRIRTAKQVYKVEKKKKRENWSVKVEFIIGQLRMEGQKVRFKIKIDFLVAIKVNKGNSKVSIVEKKRNRSARSNSH